MLKQLKAKCRYVHFVFPILFALTLAFVSIVCMEVSRFQLEYIPLKTVLQFFKIGFRFLENLFQSNENIQNFQLLSRKNISIF